LHRWQQHTNQNSNDRDNDQKLHQRKGFTLCAVVHFESPKKDNDLDGQTNED
jgi:hypothetical protein